MARALRVAVSAERNTGQRSNVARYRCATETVGGSTEAYMEKTTRAVRCSDGAKFPNGAENIPYRKAVRPNRRRTIVEEIKLTFRESGESEVALRMAGLHRRRARTFKTKT